MDRTLRFRPARAAALTLVLAACATGPTDPAPARLAQAAQLANPTATFNQLQAISAVTNTPLFESFTVLTPHFTPASAAPSVALTVLSLELATRYSPWHRSVPLTTHHAVLTRSPTLRHATAPPPGRTFVWDPTANDYIASADSGAPATGQRFVLYAISQRTGLPSDPLVGIGYVDLTDRSAGDSSALGVALVGTPTGGPATTYASYTIAGPGAGPTSLTGFVTDGTTRLDMRVDFTTSPGTRGVVTTIDVPGQDLHVSESVTVSQVSGDTTRMRTDLSVVSGGETVRATGDVTVDTTTHIGSGSMAVSVNDCAFATIALGGPDLVFTAAPGVALTTTDQTTLRALFSTSFELFGTVRLLVVPAQQASSPPRHPNPCAPSRTGAWSPSLPSSSKRACHPERRKREGPAFGVKPV